MDQYTFSFTGYVGFEDEILRLRNANRDVSRDREYLRWRYAIHSGVPDPVVFWIRTARGDAVGMAALIYRTYWLNKKPVRLGVLGDISLNLAHRGRGLGRQLLQYVRHHIDQSLPGCATFVIPTDAAKKSLLAAEWTVGGKLIPYVLPLSPVSRLSRAFRSALLGKVASFLIGKAVSRIAKWHVEDGYEMQFVNNLDCSFDVLWNSISKDNMILCDRSLETLTWRYMDHPCQSYKVAKLLEGSELAGYLIYTSTESDTTCHVYDLMVKDKKNVACMLALFSLHQSRTVGTESIRLVLSDTHPYREYLWRMGFIRRGKQGPFLIHWPKEGGLVAPSAWTISSGDKDT